MLPSLLEKLKKGTKLLLRNKDIVEFISYDPTTPIVKCKKSSGEEIEVVIISIIEERKTP